MPILDPLMLWRGLGTPLSELVERTRVMSLLRDTECQNFNSIDIHCTHQE